VCLLDLSLSLVLVLVFGVDQMYVLYVFAFLNVLYLSCSVPRPARVLVVRRLSLEVLYIRLIAFFCLLFTSWHEGSLHKVGSS